MKTIARALGVSRSNLISRLKPPIERAPRYDVADDARFLPMIRAICDDRPSYGYRRVTALLNRKLGSLQEPQVNHKRVYRMMRMNQMLLQRHTGKVTRTHEGKVITLKSNLRWCSDTLTIRCFNKEKVEVAFCLDTCDREAISYVAVVGAMASENIRDLMAQSFEVRFGRAKKLPSKIQWLSDNGPPYIAKETRDFGEKLGFAVCTTPSYSPESNGISEAFVKTLKRDYVYLNHLDDAASVIKQLPAWFEDYNENAPHKGLKMKSPREFRRIFSTN